MSSIINVAKFTKWSYLFLTKTFIFYLISIQQVQKLLSQFRRHDHLYRGDDPELCHLENVCHVQDVDLKQLQSDHPDGQHNDEVHHFNQEPVDLSRQRNDVDSSSGLVDFSWNYFLWDHFVVVTRDEPMQDQVASQLRQLKNDQQNWEYFATKFFADGIKTIVGKVNFLK